MGWKVFRTTPGRDWIFKRTQSLYIYILRVISIYYVRTHAYAYTHVYGGWFTLILRFFRKRKDKECKITANHVRKLFMIWHYPYASCKETGLTERFRSGKTAGKRRKNGIKRRKCGIHPTPILNPTPYPSPKTVCKQRNFPSSGVGM